MVNRPKTAARTGPIAQPDLVRSARMIMRLHPDLVEVLDLRAAEKRMSRSKFIETVLLGYLSTDPRNPKTSEIGRIDRKQQTPLDRRSSDPHRFAERWQRYVAAHNAIFGHAPPFDSDDPERFWSPNEDGAPHQHESEEEADDRVVAKRRVTKKK